MLTIKSGKKGPQIKKGIIDTIIKLIKNEFEYLEFFIKFLIIKLFSFNSYDFIFMINNFRYI